MKLPDDMFRLELLPYLTLDDIVNLDNACINHKYRPQLMEKINGVILLGDQDTSIKASLFKWLGMRRIYLIKMLFVVSYFNLTPSSIENDYVDQFRYTQNVVMRGAMRDNMSIFIISHSLCMLSINISGHSSDPQVSDHALQSIAEHCTGLQLLSLSWCGGITDAGLITISEHCPNMNYLDISNCGKITDTTIISISAHCTGLKSLNLERCNQITDDSIISISIHCTRLQSLNLENCYQITNASIISISTHCTGLLSLNLGCCDQISDACIISISTHCTGIQSLILDCCKITDASVISISENCTGLKELNVSWVKITDASLLAIAKNCTGLQLLRTYLCNSLSSEELRRDNFHSVSDLRAILLSIYPSLPI
jgi:F-box/leucine-rich repeat protein 2/20